jgi:hypothetical protein
MPFQFYCPQGHLLEGHESQMGTPGQCPMCGAMFVFPQMAGGGPPSGPAGHSYGAPPAPPPPFGGPPQQSGPFGGAPAGGGMFPPTPDHYSDVRQQQTEPTIYRILCPKGHEVQTPAEMLGTKAQCPYCNAVMELKVENSVEHREELEKQRRLNEQREQMRQEAQARFWLKLSIFVVVLAVGGLIGAFIYFSR